MGQQRGFIVCLQPGDLFVLLVTLLYGSIVDIEKGLSETQIRKGKERVFSVDSDLPTDLVQKRKTQTSKLSSHIFFLAPCKF